MAFHEKSSPVCSVAMQSNCPPAAVTKNLKSCCPSLYPFMKIPKASLIPKLSRSANSFNICEGSLS